MVRVYTKIITCCGECPFKRSRGKAWCLLVSDKPKAHTVVEPKRPPPEWCPLPIVEGNK